MNKIFKLSIVVFALALSAPGYAGEEHHDEHTEHGDHAEKAGHDDHDEHEEKSLKVSLAAQSHLGIEFAKVGGKSPWSLPRTALVQIKDKNGVYKKHEGAVEFIEVQILKSDKNMISVRAEGLDADDEVAVKGTKFIRIMESELNSEPAGHSH